LPPRAGGEVRGRGSLKIRTTSKKEKIKKSSKLICKWLGSVGFGSLALEYKPAPNGGLDCKHLE
jgi:hypothetical protein